MTSVSSNQKSSGLEGHKGLLVQFYDDGWRTGYLLSLHAEFARIQPIGAKGRTPLALSVRIADVKPANENESLPTVEPEQTETEENTIMATKTKKASKKGKKVVETSNQRKARLLALRAGVSSKDFKEGSHAFAAVRALEKLEKGTVADIVAYAESNNLLGSSKMKPAQAIAWIVNNLVGKEKLKVAGTFEPETPTA